MKGESIGWELYVIIGGVVFFFFLFAVLSFEWDRRDEVQKGNHTAPEPLETHARHEDSQVMSSNEIQVALESSLSPVFRSFTMKWNQRVWAEMKLHHPYLSIFSRYDSTYGRPFRALSLCFHVLCVFCIQAMIYADNDVCDHTFKEIECEHQWLTAWIRTPSVCYWEVSSRDEGDHCNSKQIGGDIQLTLKVVIISALLGILPTLLSNYVVVNTLATPTKPTKKRVANINSDSGLIGNETVYNRINKEKLQFEREYNRFIASNSLKNAKKCKDKFNAAYSTKLFFAEAHRLLKKSLLKADLERARFLREGMTSHEVCRRILCLHVQDLIPSSASMLVEKKYKQMFQDKKSTHYLLKVVVYIVYAVIIICILAYLSLFGHSQSQDRQNALIKSLLLWLVMDITVISTAILLVQHIALPSLICGRIRRSILVASSDQSIENGKSVSGGAPQEPYFDTAPYFFVSHRLASMYPNSVASSVVLGPKRALAVERRKRSCSCEEFLSLLLALYMHLPHLCQDLIMGYFNVILLGVLFYIHIYLYNMFAALIVVPTCVAVTLIIFIAYWKQRRHLITKTSSKNGLKNDKPTDDIEKGHVRRKAVAFLLHPNNSRMHGETFDLGTNASSVISLMSADMEHYQDIIVKDVLDELVSVVHHGGVGYVVDDKESYSHALGQIDEVMEKIRPSPAEETLRSIDNTLDSCADHQEGTLEKLDEVISAVDTCLRTPMLFLEKGNNSLNQKSNFEVTMTDSLDLSSMIECNEEEGLEEADGSDWKIFPGTALEEESNKKDASVRRFMETGCQSDNEAKSFTSICYKLEFALASLRQEAKSKQSKLSHRHVRVKRACTEAQQILFTQRLLSSADTTTQEKVCTEYQTQLSEIISKKKEIESSIINEQTIHDAELALLLSIKKSRMEKIRRKLNSKELATIQSILAKIKNTHQLLLKQMEKRPTKSFDDISFIHRDLITMNRDEAEAQHVRDVELMNAIASAGTNRPTPQHLVKAVASNFIESIMADCIQNHHLKNIRLVKEKPNHNDRTTPDQLLQRKRKLIATVHNIVHQSQQESAEHDDILPSFSAWYSDLLEELNTAPRLKSPHSPGHTTSNMNNWRHKEAKTPQVSLDLTLEDI